MKPMYEAMEESDVYERLRAAAEYRDEMKEQKDGTTAALDPIYSQAKAEGMTYEEAEGRLSKAMERGAD